MDQLGDVLESALREKSCTATASFETLVVTARRRSRRKTLMICGTAASAIVLAAVMVPAGWSALNEPERRVATTPSGEGLTQIAPGLGVQLPASWPDRPIKCAGSSATYFAPVQTDPCEDRYSAQIVVDDLDSVNGRMYAGILHGQHVYDNPQGVPVRRDGSPPSCDMPAVPQCATAVEVPSAGLIVVARWEEPPNDTDEREKMVGILESIAWTR